MHELWLEAGGGTDAYDAERYVGLLRDHGWTLERKPLTAICGDVRLWLVHEGYDAGDWPDEVLAQLLVDELGRHGYRIHDVARCVRPAGDPLTIGRPMTPEEEATLVPDVASPRPRRRRS